MLAAADIPQAVALQAVEYLVDLQSGDDPEATRQQLQQWRQQHPDHERAWQHIETVNSQFSALSSPAEKSLAHASLLYPGDASRRQAIKALSVLFFTSTSVWLVKEQTPWQTWVADERTAVGEQRQLAFAGYQLDLNTDTSVNLMAASAEKPIPVLEVVRGEVLVSPVLSPVSSPGPVNNRGVAAAGELQIHAAGCELVAGQARFSVYQQDDRCRVLVLQGKVEVYRQPAADISNRPLMASVDAGQQVYLRAAQVIGQEVANEQAVAWQHGMLVASSMRLQDFLAELSRYRKGKLRCAREIADLKVSGTYPLHDTGRILRALESALPVKMHYLTPYFVTAKPSIS